MQLSEVRRILSAEVLCGADRLEEEVSCACGSDFLSDVLAFVHEQNLLLTGMVNLQVIRTVEMTDIKCVVFVRGKRPGEDIVRMAEERGIVVMASPERLYTACGLLYSHGLRGN